MRTGDWSEVKPGWVLRLRGDVDWTVKEVYHSGAITVETDGEAPYTGTPTGPVRIVSEGPEMAEALLAVHLGAEAVARKDGQGRWTTPVSYPDPGSLMAHMHIFHGGTPWEDSLRELEAAHAKLHAPEAKQSASYVPHVHTPDFLKVTR